MIINAKIPLKLPNRFYKIVLKYDTFEKATYDAYLIASLIRAAKTEKAILQYIDEITGKGSLNGHFRKLYEKMKELTDEQIKGILTDSLYPVTIVDKKNHFKYYPMLNATRFNGKTYKGNLETNQNLKDMVMPKDQNCKFLSLEFVVEDGTIKSDVYNVILSRNSIQVDLEDGQLWEMSSADFYTICKDEVDANSLNRYPGMIKDEPEDNKLSILRNEVIEALINTKNYYIDENGDHCAILDDYVKRTEIVQIYSLYFYSEKLVKYSKENQVVCEKVLRHLRATNAINEFKTKSLINILNYVNDKNAQRIINYLLSRKDSKDIALLGLNLIKQGLEKGWEVETLKSIKKVMLQADFKYLYQINPHLDFEVQDLLFIGDEFLTSEDKTRKYNYLALKENMKKEINAMIGEITNSAIRQRMKKLPTKDAIYQTFNKFLNNYVGHKHDDYNSLDMAELTKEYENIKGIYNNHYQTIKSRCEKNENN